jgi:hypothetical protein
VAPAQTENYLPVLRLRAAVGRAGATRVGAAEPKVLLHGAPDVASMAECAGSRTYPKAKR